MIFEVGKYVTGMLPVFHCLSVKPPLTFPSASAYDCARFSRETAERTNFWTTVHAAAGKRMFFCAASSWRIGGPVGFTFSADDLLLPPPTFVTMIAMIPAARTIAATTKIHRLTRREDRALWTTFTAIRRVDEKTGFELEDRCLGPRAPDVPQRIAHLTKRHLGL